MASTVHGCAHANKNKNIKACTFNNLLGSNSASEFKLCNVWRQLCMWCTVNQWSPFFTVTLIIKQYLVAYLQNNPPNLPHMCTRGSSCAPVPLKVKDLIIFLLHLWPKKCKIGWHVDRIDLRSLNRLTNHGALRFYVTATMRSLEN